MDDGDGKTRRKTGVAATMSGSMAMQDAGVIATWTMAMVIITAKAMAAVNSTQTLGGTDLDA
jgi:hypothetical protein